MKGIIFSTAFGTFYSSGEKLEDSIISEPSPDHSKEEEQMKRKHPDASIITDISKYPARLLDSLDSEFRKANLVLTKDSLKASVTDDLVVIHLIHTIDDNERIFNMLSKRLREYAELFVPEYSHKVPDHERFVAGIRTKTRKELLLYASVDEKASAGAAPTKAQEEAMGQIADAAANAVMTRNALTKQLEGIMKGCCPNLLEIAGPTIGARLIAHAGDLKRLSEMPSSTVQLLGAEKALFRHMRTGAKSPKYGVIFAHQLVQKAKAKGKAARFLADKLAIAARLDRFGGEFKAKEMLTELESKLEGV